ncbi:hypothetical protein [Pseudobutyrivibrio sp.]|uniref:hypothetical protein n=1 Tax=Pseudobutyrivibrio sp. TaxID=2014367 RepID=UPI001B5B2A6F|nr:hypothetical protein [Pseudobutyrivibrio sp.]MBP3261106.1 hypothetical protein [Pseudobutyrivibrio sp.]
MFETIIGSQAPPDQIFQWLVIAFLVAVYFWPGLKEKMRVWHANDGKTINERVDKNSKEIEELKDWRDNIAEKRFANDYREIGIVKEALSGRIENERKANEELGLLMKSIREILKTLDTEGAINCLNEIDEYIIKKSHEPANENTAEADCK